MFVRTKRINHGGTVYEYLQIVATQRVGGRPRQRVVASLGRLDELVASGTLDQVIRGLVARSKALRLSGSHRTADLLIRASRIWGPALVLERLWQDLGVSVILRDLAKDHRLAFDLERAVFAAVLQQALAPIGDRAGAKWTDTVFAEGFDDLRPQHVDRALGLMWRAKARIEARLCGRDGQHASQTLDLVFIDTAPSPREPRRRGRMRQLLGVAMRRDGTPIACEFLPGNAADGRALAATVELLKRRCGITEAAIVCDRRAVRKKDLAQLERQGIGYIVGAKTRRLIDVRGPQPRNRPIGDGPREVLVDTRRYVLSYDPEQARKDARERETVVAALRQGLAAGGGRHLAPDHVQRRYLRLDDGACEIDERAIEAESRHDGHRVIRTSTDLSAEEVALAYRNLTRVAHQFRDLKRRTTAQAKGQVFACMLAVHLLVTLSNRVAALGNQAACDELARDLSKVRAIELESDGRRYLLRTEPQGSARVAFRAAGVEPPPLVQLLSDEAGSAAAAQA